MFLYVGFLYKKRVLINNNAVFARVIDIYGPHFFLFIFFYLWPSSVIYARGVICTSNNMVFISIEIQFYNFIISKSRSTLQCEIYARIYAKKKSATMPLK